MTGRPEVSAIVTSYNHRRYVARALESALAQEVDGLEVIAIDDASTDGSQRVLEGFADPRLRLELHAENRGISPTFNHGLALARGEFVAYLGSDDYWLSGHLAEGVRSLRESGAALSYARVRLVDAQNRDVTASEPLFGSAPDEGFFAALLLRSNFVPFVSVVMRREAVVAEGGFDERLVTLQDFDLWLRIAARHAVRYRNRTTAAFRWDGGNTSARSLTNSIRFRRELALILEQWLRERTADLERVDAVETVRRRLAANYRRLARRLADPRERARCYRDSLRCDPRQPGILLRYLAAGLRALPAPPRPPADERP